jgi:uncharacterized protein YcnI
LLFLFQCQAPLQAFILMTLEVPEELKSAEALSQGGWQGALVAQKVGRSFQQTNKLVMSGNR